MKLERASKTSEAQPSVASHASPTEQASLLVLKLYGEQTSLQVLSLALLLQLTSMKALSTRVNVDLQYGILSQDDLDG